MNVRDLFALFHQWCVDNCAKRTADFYRDQLRLFVSVAGELPAVAARPHHLLGERRTWHRVFAVQRLYRWAMSEGLVEENHFAKMRRPKRGSRRGTLSRCDLVRLLRGASIDFRRILLAGRETAARPQELRQLAWEHVVVADGAELEAALRAGEACFVLTEYKARKMRRDSDEVRTIPISCRLGRLMARMRRSGDCSGLVFLTSRGKAWATNTLRCRMRRMRVKFQASGSMQAEKIVMYSIRHTTATAWAASGMSALMLQILLGHTNIRMTQRYVHLSRRDLMTAWKKWRRGNRGSDQQG